MSRPRDLPITKTEFGYVQRSSFANADLLHEEVVELDSPFARLVCSDTLVYNFLLIGDQNAGKSTFLQSFTHHPDRNFIDVLAEVPVLSSVFVNTRFCVGKVPEGWQPLDEPPFLDTDLARAAVTLTRDDFVFLLADREIPIPEVLATGECDARFVVLQFIEIGGDHLDLLTDAANAPKEIADVVEKSLDLIKMATKTMYFLNLRTVDAESLTRRLRFLCSTFPPGHEVIFTLMRASEDDATASAAEIMRVQ
jgi:hypothetical protein